MKGGISMKKDLYIAVHHHRFGVSVYPVLCSHYPSLEEIIEAWKIDFEPEREEYIDIEESGKPKVIWRNANEKQEENQTEL